MWCVGTLPGRHQPVSNGDRRVPDARSRPVAERRVRPRQTLQTGRFSQLQLHGTADGLRAVASVAAICRRRCALPCGSARASGGRAGLPYVDGPRRDDGRHR